MRPITNALLALISFACAYLTCLPAFAQGEPAPTLGHPLVDQVFVYLGMLLTVLTTLGSILPRTWRLTQIIARFSTDLRGILTPDTEDDPSWAKRKRDSNVLLILLVSAALTGCPAAQGDSVLAGAKTALAALCQHLPSANLEMARQLLDRGDLKGACDYLRAELTENGDQPDVSALLALLESQIPNPN